MIKSLLLAISLTACATTTHIGNLQSDCSPGFISPSVCLLTAKLEGKSTVQYPIAGASILSVLAPAAAQVGTGALIGSGLSKAGSRTTNVNNSSGGTNEQSLQATQPAATSTNISSNPIVNTYSGSSSSLNAIQGIDASNHISNIVNSANTNMLSTH
jgi:hypothetical protein